MRRSLFIAGILAGVVLLFAAKGDGLIENTYPQLIGKYVFYKSVDNKKVTFAKSLEETCEAEINRKDQLITIRKSKRKEKVKYHFISMKYPFVEDERHVLYGRKNFYQAMFYRGDTIILENFPFEYCENYFLKVNAVDK